MRGDESGETKLAEAQNWCGVDIVLGNNCNSGAFICDIFSESKQGRG